MYKCSLVESYGLYYNISTVHKYISGESSISQQDNNNIASKFTIYHNNIQSAPPKVNSLVAIVKNIKPTVITLNEINLRKNKKIVIEGYTGFNRNRNNGHMGGVATLVAEEDADKVLKVSEGKEGNEYIVTRHSQFVVPINVINIYGEVESRATNDSVESKWTEIMEEVIKKKLGMRKLLSSET